jgi:RNA polymerase sigma-70 factor (ECF subfamily)
MELTDAELVEASLAGDADAFAVLTGRHRPGLVRFNALMIGDSDEAESLAQETLTRAYVQLADFRRDQKLAAWLRGIALNLCRNYLRQRGRHAKPTSPELLAPAPAPEGQRQGVLSGILREELNQRLWIAMGLLPTAYREALILHYVDGLDYAAISEITGVSAGALRARTMRARNLLRDSLGSVVDTWLRGDEPPEDCQEDA